MLSNHVYFEFSKHKIIFKSQITKSVSKTQISAQIHEISSENTKSRQYESVKLRFLSIMTSVTVKFAMRLQYIYFRICIMSRLRFITSVYVFLCNVVG